MEVKVVTDVMAKNDAISDSLKKEFKTKGIFVCNLMGSPGAGKTTLLETTLKELSKKFSVAVIEGDLYTTRDAERIHATGVPVLQINTVGGCHLDAQMIQDALGELPMDSLDVIIVENVGNLVCPAEFNIGEAMKITVLSVTEGEDKPIKYPLIFKESKGIVLNKIDLLPSVPFNKEKALEDIHNLNPTANVFEVSCTSREGIDTWLSWLTKEIEKVKENA